MLRRAMIGMLLASMTLASATAAAPRRHARAVSPKARPAKKVVPVAPLTSDALGLGDVKLSSIKAADGPAPSPAPRAAPTPSDEPPPRLVAPLVVTRERDKVVEPRAEPMRRFTVGVNPLPIIAGRYGLDVAVLPFRHHALVGSAYYQTFTPRVLQVLMPSAVDVSRGADAKLGGEIGYRFYSGSRGAHGFFAGVSGVAMPLALPRLTTDFRSEVVSFHAFGGAVDVGVQALTSWGFTIGGGLGVMYLAYDAPKSAAPPPGAPAVSVMTPHVLPRLLLTAGWSF